MDMIFLLILIVAVWFAISWYLGERDKEKAEERRREQEAERSRLAAEKAAKEAAEKERIVEEAIGKSLQECMDFAEDFSHFLPDWDRQMFISFKDGCNIGDCFARDAGVVHAEIRVFDCKSAILVLESYMREEFSDEEEDKYIGQFFGGYYPKSRYCMWAMENRTIDDDENLAGATFIGGETDPRVMKSILEKLKAQFPDAVEEVRTHSSRDVWGSTTIQLHFSANQKHKQEGEA